MDLSEELVEMYVGGQIEVQNTPEGYIFRGDVETITFQDGELIVQPVWLAEGEGFPPRVTKWVRTDPKEYGASLRAYDILDFKGEKLVLFCPSTGELTALIPKGGSRLEPSEVEGLEEAATS